MQAEKTTCARASPKSGVGRRKRAGLVNKEKVPEEVSPDWRGMQGLDHVELSWPQFQF